MLWEVKNLAQNYICGKTACLPPQICWVPTEFTEPEVCWPEGFDPNAVAAKMCLEEEILYFLFIFIVIGSVGLGLIISIMIYFCGNMCGRLCRRFRRVPNTSHGTTSGTHG